jgi:UDP-N-acetylenolpyruvoylglucosamine reductase
MINLSIGGTSIDNARFQLENLSEFCNKVKEVTDFDSTQWVQTEAISWCRDE